jgi:hypothetical protein
MSDFDEAIIQKVWEKAIIDPNNSPDIFRKDYAGAWIKRSDYGKRDTKYGWEVNHLKPKSKGGTDDLENLLPLHWKNNSKKDNDYPEWKTEISSCNNQNIEKEQMWHVQ